LGTWDESYFNCYREEAKVYMLKEKGIEGKRFNEANFLNYAYEVEDKYGHHP
jgi:hypothetical protein